MQRRELLEKMISTALVAGLLTPLSLAAEGSAGVGPESSSETPQSLERQLRQLARRDSSEQSTPMFLALENLASQTAVVTPPPGQLNAELAAKFEHYADLLLQYKSSADESDAVALIVLMARQQLVPGAMEECQ